MASLADLDCAVLLQIAVLLSLRDFCQLSRTSKYFKSSLDNCSPAAWEACVEHTPGLGPCSYGPTAPPQLLALFPQIATLPGRGTCYPSVLRHHSLLSTRQLQDMSSELLAGDELGFTLSATGLQMMACCADTSKWELAETDGQSLDSNLHLEVDELQHIYSICDESGSLAQLTIQLSPEEFLGHRVGADWVLLLFDNTILVFQAPSWTEMLRHEATVGTFQYSLSRMGDKVFLIPDEDDDTAPLLVTR